MEGGISSEKRWIGKENGEGGRGREGVMEDEMERGMERGRVKERMKHSPNSGTSSPQRVAVALQSTSSV